MMTETCGLLFLDTVYMRINAGYLAPLHSTERALCRRQWLVFAVYPQTTLSTFIVSRLEL